MTNTEYNHYLAYKDAINLYIEMRMVLEPNSALMIPILNYCNQQGNIIDSKCPSCLTDALIYFRYAAKKYADTGRIQAMERIDPLRVTVTTNGNGTEIDGYSVDGYPIDPSELVVFTGLDEGILNRAGRTIRAASALEKTAYDFAIDPNPQTILKNSGVALPKDRVAALVAAFKNRTSKALRATQTLGRILRKVEGKTAYFIELYVPDTQDENWLKKSLVGQKNVLWCNSIDQIYEIIQADKEKLL